MARGNDAKEYVVNKIAKAFGDAWIGEYSKKYYVWSSENGEQVQIAISLTCPKVPVEVAAATPAGDFDFENMDESTGVVAATGYQPAEITAEERERVNDLIRKLGL